MNNKHFFNRLFLFLFILFLPTQFGKHFFFSFSYLSGVRVDYLAPTLYLTDIIICLLLLLNPKTVFKFFNNNKLLFFLGFLAVNVILSASWLLALYGTVKLVELLIVFSVIKSAKKIDRLVLVAFTLGALVEVFLVSAELITKHSVQGIFYFFGERSFSLSTLGVAKASFFGQQILRPYATFSHPNSLSGFTS